MPYFHLSLCPTRKIIQHTVFLFNFTLRTRQKTRIFHQRSQKIHLDLNLSLFPLFRLNTILVTNLETLVWFSPSPMLIWVLQSSHCFKIRLAQHCGRRGANVSENEGVRSECKKLGENSRQMAPVSTICDEYCLCVGRAWTGNETYEGWLFPALLLRMSWVLLLLLF